MNKNVTCCFTGHRPAKLPWGYDEQNTDCILLKTILTQKIELLIKSGVTNFITGMAQGIDILAAEIVLNQKTKNPAVKLIAAIPHEGQEHSWNQNYQHRYKIIRKAVDKEIVFHQHYTRGCMHERNRYMVDNSAYMIAVFDGKKGGTKSTIEYALKQGTQIIIIDPSKLNAHI